MNRHRQLQAVVRTCCKDSLILILVVVEIYIRATNHPSDILITQRLDILVEVYLKVSTCQHLVGIPIPVAALHTTEEFKLYALQCTNIQACTTNGIVNTEASLLVGTEDESTTKLVVEITYCQVYTIITLKLSIYMWHTPSLESRFKTRQWMFVVFETHASLYVFAIKTNIGISICQHIVLVCASSELLVFLWNQDIALYASVYSNAIIALCIGISHRHHSNKQGSVERIFHINLLCVLYI